MEKARRLIEDNTYYIEIIDKAIISFTKAIEIDKKNYIAYEGRGVAHYIRGNSTQAISDYTKVIKLKPDYSHAYVNRASAYFYGEGDIDKAEKDFNKAIKIKPNFAIHYLRRGDFYGVIGNNNQAISDLNKAIEFKPDYADAHCIRGSIYGLLHKYDKAIADFNKAIEINPGHSEFYVTRGTVYYKNKDLDRALSDLGKAIELNPNNINAYNLKVGILTLQSKYDEAWKAVNEMERKGFYVMPNLRRKLQKVSGRWN